VEYKLQRHKHIIAQCHHDRPKHRPRYEIRVPRLYERLGEECRARGYVSDSGPDIPVMLIGIAAHEVRHRVQDRRPDIRRFTPFCKSTTGFILTAQVQEVSREFKNRQTTLQKTVKGKNLAGMFYNEIELDAVIVERLVSILGLYRPTMEEVARLVMVQPKP
jgi:hypothetical protein